MVGVATITPAVAFSGFSSLPIPAFAARARSCHLSISIPVAVIADAISLPISVAVAILASHPVVIAVLPVTIPVLRGSDKTGASD